jgi:hypothetical protein
MPVDVVVIVSQPPSTEVSLAWFRRSAVPLVVLPVFGIVANVYGLPVLPGNQPL